MKDKSYICLGWFDSITQVWELHPEGGHEGEYFYVDSQKYRWNKTTRNWEYAATDPVAGGNMTVGNDLTVNNCATIGKDVRVHENVNVDRNLYVGGKIFAKGVKQPNLGFFSSEEALRAAHPTPEVGMWASVGTTMPGTVWRCETAGVWTNTEEEGGVDPTDVNYGIVNNLESESTTEALSAAMGAKLQNEKLGVVPQGLTEDQKNQVLANTGLDKIIDGLRKRTGYFVCSTPWYAPDKIVSAPNFELYPGNCIKIKMLYHNEAVNPTLNINNTAPRPLFFDKVLCSKGNTWIDGEVIEVYYDGECYHANSIDGGATFKTGERVRDVGIDHEPIKDSDNLITSGGVYDAMEDLHEDWAELLENYKPIVINGDVTNAPDEEDITMGDDNLLKFKNRGKLFGKGFTILRRNMVTIEGQAKNVLTQEMVNETNTIYEVRYDFDLNGEDITIPTGSTLSFEGGSFTNGHIISNDTIVRNLEQFDEDVYVGMFYNVLNQPINYKGKHLDKFEVDPLYGELIANISTDLGSVQAVVANNDYIFVFFNQTVNSQTRTVCVLYDRNFNYLGKSLISEVCHANDATIYDGYVYLCINVSGYTGLLKVSVNSLIVNCQSDSPTTSQHIDFGKGIVSIDYDEVTDTFALDIGGRIYIYSTDFQQLKESVSYKAEAEAILGRSITLQGHVYKNGIVYSFDWDYVHQSGARPFNSAVVVISDTITDKVVEIKTIVQNSSFVETEGVCKDPVTGQIMGVTYDHSYSGYNAFRVVLYGDDDSIVRKNNRTSMATFHGEVNGASLVYIDNTYTGWSDGSKLKPYKSIGEAFVMTPIVSERVEFELAASNVTYYCYDLYITSKNFRLHATNLGDVKVSTYIRTRDSFLALQNIIFEKIDGRPTSSSVAYLLINQNSYVALNSVRFNDLKSSAIYINNSKAMVNGVEFVGDENNSSEYCIRIENSSELAQIGDIEVTDANFIYIEDTNNARVNLQQEMLTFNNVPNILYAPSVKNNRDCVTFNPVMTLEQLEVLDGYCSKITGNLATVDVISSITCENGSIIRPGRFYIDVNHIRNLYKSDIAGLQGSIGPSSARPEIKNWSAQYYDTTINKPIWWNGTNWIDAMGEIV